MEKIIDNHVEQLELWCTAGDTGTSVFILRKERLVTPSKSEYV